LNITPSLFANIVQAAISQVLMVRTKQVGSGGGGAVNVFVVFALPVVEYTSLPKAIGVNKYMCIEAVIE
jgi:hypothetical protein